MKGLSVVALLFFSVYTFAEATFTTENRYTISNNPKKGEFSPSELQTVINSSPKNSEIVFLPGDYFFDQPIVIKNKKYLRITSLSQRAHLRTSNLLYNSKPDIQLYKPSCQNQVDYCRQIQDSLVKKSCFRTIDSNSSHCVWKDNSEGEWISDYPDAFAFSLFRIENSQFIHFDLIKISEVYPSAFIILDSSHFSLTRSLFVGGTNIVTAKSHEKSFGNKSENSQHFKFIGNKWDQDPSEEIWWSLDWQHVHHGRHNYFNGAFLQGRDVKGDFIFKDNEFKNAFNVVRSKIKAKHCKANWQKCDLNENFVFEGNEFLRISDNAIEPENFFRNWTIRKNFFVGIHAPFSLDGTTGFGFNIIENGIWVDTKPRKDLGQDQCSDWAHDFGRVIKIGKDHQPIKGLRIENNNWELSYPDAPEFTPLMHLADAELPKDTIINDPELSSLIESKKLVKIQSEITGSCPAK